MAILHIRHGVWRFACQSIISRKSESLRHLAITKSSLFPDLAALAEELKERSFLA